MKKFLYLVAALALFSCGGSNSGSSNPYIGNIAILEAQEDSELSQCHGEKEYVPVQVKYKELRQQLFDALEGTIMPCVAVGTGKGEGAVKVLGNKAVFKDGQYHVLISFSKSYSVWGLDYTNIDFGNMSEGIAYGTKAKVETRLNFKKGNVYLYSFDIEKIKADNPELLTKKVDLASIVFNDLNFKEIPDGENNQSVETLAINVFYKLHELAKANDTDTFMHCDEILSDDDINDEELKKFMEALDIVSTICPDQTKEIKEYSKKLAGQGFTIKSDYLKN